MKMKKRFACISTIIFVLVSCVSVNDDQEIIQHKYQVQINRDFWGIPHIRGVSNADVAYGIGWVHAEDAYDDLTELIPLYRGNNAEFNGFDGVASDYLVRLLKVHEKVKSIALSELDPEILNMAKAYVQGVNDFSRKHPEKINTELHPFTVKDVIAGSYIQHMIFAGLNREIASLNKQNNSEIPTGSNAIAINGNKTKGNSSYLLINSHQPLAGPVGWYELNVKSNEGWQAHGGNFPGSFLINIGFNKDIGWGVTVNRPDLIDIFKLNINPDNKNEYLIDGKWKGFEKETDYLKIKLLGIFKIKFKRDFLYSDFGPVIDVNDNQYAIRVSTAFSFKEIQGWFQLNQAQSVDEFETILEQRLIPSFNFVVMDKNQNIGYFYNGIIPMRRDAVGARHIIVSDHSDYIFDHSILVNNLPALINPSNGWLQSTNQDPYHVSHNYSINAQESDLTIDYESRLTNRSFRANEILSENKEMGLDDFIALKFDNAYSINSRQYKYLKEVASSSNLINGYLKKWDLKTDFENEYAGINSCIMAQEWSAEFNNDSVPSPNKTIKICLDLFKQLNKGLTVPWKEITTISRANRSFPIQGSVDTLRAVYGLPNKLTNTIDMNGGDGLFFILGDENGERFQYGMHNFGSSRNSSSVHFDDQTFLFSQEALRFVPLEL